MNKALIGVVIALGLVLVASVIYLFLLMQDNNALAAELQSVRNALTSTQSELSSTNQTLAATQQELAATLGELDSAREEIDATRSEIDSTKAKLASTRAELATTNQTLRAKLAELSSTSIKLTVAEESVSNLQDELANTQKKLATAEETLGGLGISIAASWQCFDVTLVDNPEAKNPTWKELMSFLSEDKTETHVYIPGEYDCSQFSRDVHNNAEATGIRSAEVHVLFDGEKTGHALNAFLTTDYGLVYIDCTQTQDRITYLKADKVFKAVPAEWQIAKNLRNDSWWDSLTIYYYMKSSTGGEAITDKIIIYW